jgi:hypothetical protein
MWGYYPLAPRVIHSRDRRGGWVILERADVGGHLVSVRDEMCWAFRYPCVRASVTRWESVGFFASFSFGFVGFHRKGF